MKAKKHFLDGKFREELPSCLEVEDPEFPNAGGAVSGSDLS